ncbi:MAG: OB-fold nucleic acid binding domain-containing protein [Bacilli bacterium]
MKKAFLIVMSVGLLFFSSCGTDTSSQIISSETSNLESLTEENESSISTESTFATISSLRDLDVGTKVQVKGVVLKHVYTGQGTPYITGFYLIDETGCIYIYGEDLAQSVEVNQEISLSGEVSFYIPETDESAAASTGYKGALQLTSPTLLETYSEGVAIPTSSIDDESDINDIQSISLTTDITGNVYRLQGKVIVSEQPGYTNYYLQSLDLTTTLPFYTQSNGKDYAWLDEYSDKYVDMYVVVMNGKPSRNEWRGLPVQVLSEYTPTSDDYCYYGNMRIFDTYFAEKYTESITITVPKEDPYIEGLTYSFSVGDDVENIAVSTTDVDNVIEISIPDIETKENISITSKYEETLLTTSYSLTLSPKASVDTLTLDQVRDLDEGTEVTVEGVVARITYKSGNKRLGFIIQDATGSMIVYNSAETIANLDDIEEGNSVVIKGTFSRYISDSDVEKAEALGYRGDTQITDVEILNNDNKINSLYDSSIIKDQTIAEIVATDPSTDPVGNIYQCQAVVEKTETTYYTAYRVSDPEDSSKSLSLYSQMQGSEFEFLDEYDGTEVTLLFAIQNIKYSSGSFYWRICAISVVD